MRVVLELQQQRFNLRMNKVYLARQLAFSFLKENVCSVLVVELLQLHPPSFVSLARLFGGGGGGLFAGHSTCTSRFGLKPVINLSG